MKSRFFEFILRLGLQLILLAVNKLGMTWPTNFLIRSDVDAIRREVKAWHKT